ncbi:MAG TPA: tRNA (guanosine(37)-N1)-methyltransferase TrmD [Armatimonadota bacterium]|nr:tRNA (guanosine(37)-N1)-methyltransferase TrmD [Armatimonadota bacterium]
MRFDILTLFPNALESWIEFSILKRAREKGLVEIGIVDIRSFTTDRHRTADEPPYGGGQGMLLKPEPVVAAVESCLADGPASEIPARVILLSPLGRRLNQTILEGLAREQHLVLICGRYEGVDERVRSLVVTDEISIGDFVLTGGELAAAVLVDGVARLLPGVLGKDQSAIDESFTSGLLEYPQYTRPPEFAGETVPAILVSGNHQEVQQWRERQSLLRTAAWRPDLLPPDWRDRLSPRRKPPRKRRASGQQP